MATSHADMLGMRRITWVRVIWGRRDARAEVHGIGHRLPRTVQVPMAIASALVHTGVPLILRHEASSRATARTL